MLVSSLPFNRAQFGASLPPSLAREPLAQLTCDCALWCRLCTSKLNGWQMGEQDFHGVHQFVVTGCCASNHVRHYGNILCTGRFLLGTFGLHCRRINRIFKYTDYRLTDRIVKSARLGTTLAAAGEETYSHRNWSHLGLFDLLIVLKCGAAISTGRACGS